MTLEKYSIGIGDRFGHEGAAQLRALQMALQAGVQIVPVWNKSNREHTLIGTTPDDVRAAADAAVNECGWKLPYYVDADHIGMKTVERFIDASNFFTIDVADFIGKRAEPDAVDEYVHAIREFTGRLEIPGVSIPLLITDDVLREVATKYLAALEEAGRVYRHIAERKGAGNFVTEISVDESAAAQTPAELLLILAAVARYGIPIQTIAPKFTGAFLKGVDYVGDVKQFAREFDEDLSVIAFAVKRFGLPQNLKLSVHSGSDKFSLYPVIHHLLKKHDAGVHLKTAGTTWLEEVIGLAESGTEGLALVKRIYTEGFRRYEEMAQPYLAVIHIERSQLPSPQEVDQWTSGEFIRALRHNRQDERFDRQFRQLMHIAFRVAAEMGTRYTDLLKHHREIVARNVTENLYHRHIQPLFLGGFD